MEYFSLFVIQTTNQYQNSFGRILFHLKQWEITQPKTMPEQIFFFFLGKYGQI